MFWCCYADDRRRHRQSYKAISNVTGQHGDVTLILNPQTLSFNPPARTSRPLSFSFIISKGVGANGDNTDLLSDCRTFSHTWVCVASVIVVSSESAVGVTQVELNTGFGTRNPVLIPSKPS